MAFEWTENVGVGAVADAADMNEVQDNIDSIYAALGITRDGCGAGAGWTEFPIAGGGVAPKASVQPQQLRDAIDYAYENKCPSDNAVDNTVVDDDENTGYNDGDQAGVDATHYPGYLNDDNETYQDGYKPGVDATNYPGYQDNYNQGDDATAQITVYPSHWPGYAGGDDSEAKYGEDAEVYSTHMEDYLALLKFLE